MMRLVVVLILMFTLICQWTTTACDICMLDSICTDDSIDLNISISINCSFPTMAIFSYDTDVESERHYTNLTIDCVACRLKLEIEPIRDAWTYYVQLEQPQLVMNCPKKFDVKCGGATSRIVWISTAALSGLLIIFGIFLSSIRFYRRRVANNERKKLIDNGEIN